MIDKQIFKDIFSIFSWSVVAQLVSMLAVLVLPRLYTPSDFGIFAIFSSTVVVLGIIIAFRLEYAIPLPDAKKESIKIYIYCIYTAIFFGLLLGLIFYGASLDKILSYYLNELNNFWLLILIASILLSWYTSSLYLTIKFQDFSYIGKVNLISVLFMNFIQIGLGFLFGSNALWLILGLLSSSLVGIVFLISHYKNSLTFKFNTKSYLRFIKKYKKYPLAVAPGSLLDGISVLIPVAFVSYNYSLTYAGFYTLADRILKMPVTSIGSSISQVLYKKLADFNNEKKSPFLFILKTWGILFFIGFPFVLLLFFFGKEIFEVFFGHNWSVAGDLAAILVWGAFLYFIHNIAFNYIVANKHAILFLTWQVLKVFIFVIICYMTIANKFTIEIFSLYLTLGQVVLYLISLIIQLYFSTYSKFIK